MSPRNDKHDNDQKPSQNSDHDETDHDETDGTVIVRSTINTADGKTEQSLTVEINEQEQEQKTTAIVDGVFGYFGVTSSGIKPKEKQREMVQRIVSIGNKCNRDIGDLIQPILNKPPEERMEMFRYITKELFKDGVNWGRIAVFLVVAAKLAWSELSKTSVVRDFLLNFIREHLFAWIIQSGGWDSIKDYANNVISASRERKLNMALGAISVFLLGYIVYTWK